MARDAQARRDRAQALIAIVRIVELLALVAGPLTMGYLIYRNQTRGEITLAEENASVVKKFAGHASIKTTQDYYTDIADASMRSAQESLPFSEVIARAADMSDTYQAPDEEENEDRPKIINLDHYRA